MGQKLHTTDEVLGRDGWTFTTTAAWLLAHVRRQRATSEERLSYWRGEHKVREGRLRRKGVNVREAIAQAQSMSNNSTQYYKQPTLDTDIVLSLSEAQSRITVHEKIIAAMQRWEIMLALDPLQELDLTFEDAEYFNLRAEATA